MAQQIYELDGPKQFFFPFPVQEKSQLTLMVMPDGTPVPEAEWDVTGAAPDAFAVSVFWPSAPIDGSQQLHIARYTEVERVTDFLDDAAVPARALNAEFNNIYQILGEVEDRIDDLEDRMDALELRVDDLELRMDLVEGRLDAVEADIAAIFTQLAVLDSRVTDLEARMAAAEGRLDAAESRLDFVEDNLGTSTYQVNGVTQATNVRTLTFQDSELLPGQFTVTQTGPESAQLEVRPDVPAVSGTVALHVGALVTREGGAQQAIPAGIPTEVQFSNIQYDDVEIFDNGQPTRLTAPVGTTRLQLTAAVQLLNDDPTLIEIRKNGSVFPGGTGGTESMQVLAGGTGRVGSISAVVDAIAGDYFEIFVFSPAGQTVLATGQTFFAMTLMQATGLLPAAGGALVSLNSDQVVSQLDLSDGAVVAFDTTQYDDASIVDGNALRMPVSLSVDRARLTGSIRASNIDELRVYVAKNSASATAPNFIGAPSFRRSNHSTIPGEANQDVFTFSSPILEVAPGDTFRVFVSVTSDYDDGPITIHGGNTTWFGLELVGTPQPGFSAGGIVNSVVGGDNITVDDTDPANPIANLNNSVSISGSFTSSDGDGFASLVEAASGPELNLDNTQSSNTLQLYSRAVNAIASTGTVLNIQALGSSDTINMFVGGSSGTNQVFESGYDGTNTSISLQHNGSDSLVVDVDGVHVVDHRHLTFNGPDELIQGLSGGTLRLEALNEVHVRVANTTQVANFIEGELQLRRKLSLFRGALFSEPNFVADSVVSAGNYTASVLYQYPGLIDTVGDTSGMIIALRDPEHVDGGALAETNFFRVAAGSDFFSPQGLNIQYQNTADEFEISFFTADPVPQPVLTTGTDQELREAIGSSSGLGLVDDSGVPAGTISAPIPAVLAYLTSSQEIAPGPFELVSWDATAYDTFSIMTSATEFTIPSWATHMRATFDYAFQQNSTGDRFSSILIDGAGYSGQGLKRIPTTTTGPFNDQVQTGVTSVTPGQVITFQVGQSSGDPLDIISGNATWAMIELFTS